jgi:hypothetical protein
MAWSAKEIRKKKYTPFPGHGDSVSKAYHSERLPNPNVIRIEVLSPAARSAYLNGGLYAMTNRLQQTLMESMLYDDATKPFYGFFDPKENEGITFGVKANWKANRNKGFGAAMKQIQHISDSVSKIPVVGIAGKAVGGLASAAGEIGEQAASFANKAGLNTDSTGACTMRDFSDATFLFDKTVKCKWYMPEQEYMARLSIARLLTLTFVRSANMDDSDMVGKLTRAVSELTTSQEWNDAMDAVNDVQEEIVAIGGQLKRVVKSAATDALGSGLIETAKEGVQAGGDFISGLADGLKGSINNASQILTDKTIGEHVDTLKNNVAGMAPSEDTKALAADVMKMIMNDGLNFMLKVNSFFGGNITVNPFPVRLTMGHILDIEPVVIEGVTFHSSKEQFISEDGTHIPLYITADIKFGMWMTPDPKKGFIRWMGDDVFNSGRYLKNAKSSGTAGTSSGTSGNKKKGASGK